MIADDTINIPVLYYNYESQHNGPFFSQLFKLRQVSTQLKTQVNNIYPEMSEMITYINRVSKPLNFFEKHVISFCNFDLSSLEKAELRLAREIKDFVKDRLDKSLENIAQPNMTDWKNQLDQKIEKSGTEVLRHKVWKELSKIVAGLIFVTLYVLFFVVLFVR